MPHAVATHIDIRTNRDGHDRPFIEGTRVRVQDVAMMAQVQGLTPGQIIDALPHLRLSQVHAALSYYFDHRAEIHSHLKEDKELAEELRKLRGPGVLERSLVSLSGE